MSDSPEANMRAGKEKKPKNAEKGKKRQQKVYEDEEEDEEKVMAENKKRKETREKQNSLIEEILDDPSRLDDLESDAYSNARDKLNEAFEGVMHTREGCIDATARNILAFSMRKKAERLQDMSKRLEFTDFAASIKQQYTPQHGRTFCWRSLGQDVGRLFQRPVPLTTMLGNLDVPEKIRKVAAERKKREKLVEVRPEEIINEKTLDEDGNEEEDPDKCEATTARIHRQHSFMEAEKASQASQGGPTTIDLLSLLVDPKDHVQTVENFFDYAFLIKTKHSEFVRPEDGQGYAPGVHTQGPENFVGRENRQLVLSLSMKDVKAMAACLESQGRECPLHREDELYEAANAAEQADILTRQATEKSQKSSEQRSQKNQERRTQKSQALTQASTASSSR